METLGLITAIYFCLGLIALSITVFTHGNIFTKTIVRIFQTPNNFNAFMLFYWLIPTAFSLLIYIAYQLLNFN